MIAEMNAFLFNLAEFAQRKYLEASRIGQNRAIPIHKLVKAARFFDDLVARSEPKVVRIAQNNACCPFLSALQAPLS